MSAPLKIGDLVMVIRRPCTCTPDRRNGVIRSILGITHKGTKCGNCGRITPGTNYRLGNDRLNGTSSKRFWGRPAWCLKKIPPLGELDGKVTQEPLVNPFQAEAKRRHAEEDRTIRVQV